MKTNSSTNDMEFRATEALRALLGQVSAIKLKEIRRVPRGPMLARVEVLGHAHTLACEINDSARPEGLRNALQSLIEKAARYDSAATPVLIASYLSPEAQALCKQCDAGYVDLEGNARLALGEVFIGKRSLPCRNSIANRSLRSAPVVVPDVLRGFPPSRVLAAVSGRSATA